MEKPRHILPPPNDLCKAIQTSDWSTAFSILSSDTAHSQLSQLSTSSGGYSGWTPLHWACRNPDTPPELVRSILSLSPNLVLVQDNTRRTPLHYAIRNSVDEISILLVQTCPEAKFIKGLCGQTPFEEVMFTPPGNDRSAELLKTFIMSGDEKKAISLMFSVASNPRRPHFSRARWNMGLRLLFERIDWSCVPPSIMDDTIVDELGEEPKIRNIYDYFSVYIRAASLKTMKDTPGTKPFLPVHVTLSMPLPWSLFTLALVANLSDVWKEDENGNLPLHVAAVSRSVYDGMLYNCERCVKKMGKTWYQKKSCCLTRFCPECFEKRNTRDEDEDSEYPSLDFGSSYDSSDDDEEGGEEKFSLIKHADKIPEAINQLLTINSKAASVPNKKERLPLNLAIESGKYYEKGINAIFLAAPTALQTRDMATHLYPFMLAAVLYERNEEKYCAGSFAKNDLDEDRLQKFTTCFKLLTENPVMVRGGFSNAN